MGQTGSGSGTSFENMSHERMLEWLDQANSGAVQGAADKLRHASEEIRKIAEDLKIRPQWVEWKGTGADAFRTWSADLANATLRLGAYSEGASKWLAEASGAIASAQASIPRTEPGDQAGLDAARAVGKDSGASAADKEAAAALLSTKERDRQEAAAQMRRLAQTYSFSSSQMGALEKPVFPPPPQAISPESKGGRGQDSAIEGGTGSGANAVGTGHASVAEGQDEVSSGSTAAQSGSLGYSPRSAEPPVSQSVDMGINAVTAPPPLR